jgi:hypothetical protein
MTENFVFDITRLTSMEYGVTIYQLMATHCREPAKHVGKVLIS